MSRGSKVTAEAIRQMLVGLAEALRTAQNSLTTEARSAELGGVGYEIPYLDFAFEVEFTSREAEEGNPVVELRPRYGSPPMTNDAKEITSRVAGRLVSVPPHGGKPAPRLDLRLQEVGKDLLLLIQLTNAAGELLAGVPVALEVDVETTERLTGRRPAAEERLSLLETQVTRTDDDGQGRVKLDRASLNHGARVVVRAEARGASARIVISDPGEVA